MRWVAPLYLCLFAWPALVFAQAALPVEIIRAHPGSSSKTLSLIGTVEAQTSYPVSFRTAGRVDTLAVEVGDHLPQGALIARLDRTVADSAHASSLASLQAAKARLEQARQARDRAQGLLDAGSGTQATLDTATETWLSVTSALAQAQAAFETAQQGLEDTALHALEPATVIARDVDPNEIVAAGQAVVTLATDGQRVVIVQAPDIAGLAALRAQKAQVTMGQNPPLDAVVTEVAPILSETGTVRVKLTLNDATQQLPIGASVRGQIIAPVPAQITLPWTALMASAQGPAVWIIDPQDMTAHLRQITVSGYTSAQMQISDGVEAGDWIVGAGAHQLYEGRVVEETQ
ncbi:hypothetical protein BFP70_00020 [Thioclava sp. SK-1]|uniref:efflux RND transporter periplasmic adaptor subunit n=1 Tax=Thioclava sp. SK-1 TaxID=1889770 RepID=UPI0008264537|nr:efflux RND transporter periplasmic adaptor subunit [Thioclava sp. SK-1]OCX66597.1 hypothetical protein BFP70_00020 [Thioclava sp. SK-1]